nr:CueP family metal-binding protein [Bacillus alkalicellulosilyticus]
MTGCQGELVEEYFDVYIEEQDGNVVVDETMQSLRNGFLDFWLKRDQTYNITISIDGKMVEGKLSTFKTDPTCITTMQLVEESSYHK